MLAFYAVGMGAVCGLIFRKRDERPRRTRPGAGPLRAFAWWSLLVSLTAPLLFPHTLIIPLSESNELGYLTPSEVTFGSSQVIHAAYVVLVICVVFYLGRFDGPLSPKLLGLGMGLVVALSFYRYLSLHFGLPWPDAFFDNTPGARLIDTTETGEVRLRGVYSEPSGLASGSIAAITFFLMRMPRIRGWKLIGTLAITAMAVVNIANSTSTSAIIAGCCVPLLFGAVALVKFLRNEAKISFRGALLVVLFLGAVSVVTPRVAPGVFAGINGRLGGISGETRLGGNIRALHALLDTYGLGIGLGSTETFALWATVLGGVGIVGSALLSVAIWRLVKATWRYEEYRSVSLALLALLISRMIAGSNLTDPVIWLSLGLLANVAWRNPNFRQASDLDTDSRTDDLYSSV